MHLLSFYIGKPGPTFKVGPKALVSLSGFAYNISMKISKLGLLIFVVSICAPAAFAQMARGLKYVPQAVKGAKAVPYVVSPKLSPALRTNLAVPVVRPNVAAQVAPAVERAVAAKVTVQEIVARLETNLNKLEEYAKAHNNKLPLLNPRAEGYALRRQFLSDMQILRNKKIFDDSHPLSRRYKQLVEAELDQHLTTEERLVQLEQNLNVLEEYAKTHDNKLPPAHADTKESNLRLQVIKEIHSLKQTTFGNHPLFQRYKQLVAAESMQQPTVQERLARLEKNLNLLEEYAKTHDSRLPKTENGTKVGYLRKQVCNDIHSLRDNFRYFAEGKSYPFLLQRYKQLVEIDKQQQKLHQNEEEKKAKLARMEKRQQEKLARAEQREQERQALAEQREQERQALVEQREQERQANVERQSKLAEHIREFRLQEMQAEVRQRRAFRLQEKAWADLIAEEQNRTEAEEVTDANAATVATKAESNVPLTGNVTTDDYVEQLLNFYNKLDPLGTGTIQ